MLDDWLTHGIVTVDATDYVVIDTTAFVPRPVRAEQSSHFGRNLRDHLAAAGANVTVAGPDPFLVRAAHYDHLTARIAALLEDVGRDAAQRLLTEVNRQALELLDSNDRELESTPQTPRRRLNLGLYLFIEHDSTGEEP